MQLNRTRQYGLMICIALLLFTAGCFQPAGGGLEATAVGQGFSTFTPIPTETPPPTETPEPIPTDTPEPTIEIIEEFVVEEPTDFVLIAFTNTPDPFALPEGTPVAMIPEQLLQVDDPLIQTATALALLQSGQPLPQQEEQQQEFQQEQPITDPLALTATALVGGATQTAAFPMTQTAEALLGPTPTPTPTDLPEGATPAPPTGTCIHTVTAGQNLFRISLQYNTTVEALAAANGIVNPNLIVVGQQLTIPGCGTGGTTPPGGGGAAGPGEQVYITRQGDTLFQISLQYNKTVNDLAARNNIANINLILIGQEIIIPA